MKTDLKTIRFRVWPALVVLLLAAIATAWIWLTVTDNDQGRVMQLVPVMGVAGLALMVWWLLFSGLSRLARYGGFALAVIVLAGFSRLVRYDGVDGNLVPVFTWRWSSFGAESTPEVGAVGDLPDRFEIADGDYPQFLGPRRDARLSGPALARDWESRPPRLLWKQPIGEGWSAFATVGDVAITQEQRGPDELVVAYRLKTGKPLWLHADRLKYTNPVSGTGPRATPTIAGDGKVYTLGATGQLNCLRFRNGEVVWQHNIEREHNAGGLGWGRSTSPLVYGDLVIVNPGGAGRALAAYQRHTGQLVWTAGGDGASYASPSIVTLKGRPQILIMNQGSLTGHDPGDGRLLWRQPFPAGQANCSNPIALSDDTVFASTGYGIGCKLYRISEADGSFDSRLVWETNRLKAKFTNVVFHQGALYGLDDGILVSLDPSDGQRHWKRGRFGHGQLILVGDLLLILSEAGEAVLVEASPERFNLLARFQALEGKTWNSPALAGNILLVRNHHEAAAYELPLAE